MAGVDRDISRIAAPTQQGHDPIAHPPARRALAKLGHHAGDFQPQGLGRAWGRRVDALALHQIRAIDPGRLDLDQNLTGAGTRRVNLNRFQ
jgi:hypothetical protein